MDNEHRMSIIDNYGDDTITIYWRNKVAQFREEWYYIENGNFMVQTFERSEGYAPQSRKPFLVLPNRMGKIFLELIGAEIEKNGFNQKNVDMQAGKTELLEHRLKFSDDQLVKFIDYFTTPPSTNE
jgi:hypothetical protein